MTGLGNLEILSLDENPLAELKSGVFADLALEEISTGAFTGMPLLEVLVLSDNRFDALPRGVFSSVTKLKDVWMSSSQLTTLPSGVFKDLGELTLLHLYQSQLTELPDSLFTGLYELAQLDLEENPGTPFTLSVHWNERRVHGDQGYEQREHPGSRRPGAGGPCSVPRHRCRRGRHPQSVLVFG